MQGRLVFLLEERSMANLLNNWLPKLFPGWQEVKHFLCIPHEGKSDLAKSIPRKLRAWRTPGDRFVIVFDNDHMDCQESKRKWQTYCKENGRPDTLIRFVCQELESWYLGDLQALAGAFDSGKVNTPKHCKRYISPDDWHKPSEEIKRLLPGYQKISGARKMADFLDPATNRSHSMQVFVQGIRRMADEMGYHGSSL